MTINEKAAYLKGLFEGQGIAKDSDAGKLFAVIIDTIGDIAQAVVQLEARSEAMSEALEELDEAIEELDGDLEELDEDVEELSEMLEADYGQLYGYDDDEDDDDDVDIDWEEEYYELKCPSCGEEIVVEEDILARGEMKCPTCGESLEFDLSEIKEDCGCGCEHGHHHGEGCGCKDEDGE